MGVENVFVVNLREISGYFLIFSVEKWYQSLQLEILLCGFEKVFGYIFLQFLKIVDIWFVLLGS